MNTDELKNRFDDTISEAYNKIKNQPLLITDDSIDSALVVGDIHGDLDSLNYAISLREKLDAKYLILLGDYVDRGNKPVEVMYEVANLIINDKNIVALRGNHEDPKVYRRYNYYDGIRRLDLSDESSKLLFGKLPLVLLTKDIVYLHGFIDHQLKGIEALQQLDATASFEQPSSDAMIADNHAIFQLLWNDPVLMDDDNCTDFCPYPYKRYYRDYNITNNGYHTSGRGTGAYYIGQDLTTEFLKMHNKRLIVRAHVELPTGYGYFHNKQVLSLFSAGQYYSSHPHYAEINGTEINIHAFEQ